MKTPPRGIKYSGRTPREAHWDYRCKRYVRVVNEETGEKWVIHPITGVVLKHPRHGEVYTPLTPQLLDELWRLRDKYGTWRMFAEVVEVRTRILRKLRHQKAVSFTFWEKILMAAGLEWTIYQYPWFTPEDLVRLGIWEDCVYYFGKGKMLRVYSADVA